MNEKKESLIEKLTVAIVQTLIFGIVLAVFGYWLDRRIETYKHELSEQAEKTKVLLSSLEPRVKQRRDAYLELQSSARQVKDELQMYYWMADAIPDSDARRWDINSLENAMGIGSGSGAGGTLTSKRDAVSVIENFILLRRKYESVSSAQINQEVDEFIDIVMADLKNESKKTNQSKTFHNLARVRLDEGFQKLNSHIESALGIDQLPLK